MADSPIASPEATDRVANPVWGDMNQQQLDAAYNQSVYAPNLKQVLGRFASNSDDARAALGAPQRHRWGEAEAAGLDLFAPENANGAIHVFVHGGAWRADPALNYAFLAECFTAEGASFTALDFSGIDALDGDLARTSAQIPEALEWLYHNAPALGFDPDRIHLGAHSSGSHLAGTALLTDWTARGLPADLVKSAILISGMYDLEAVSRSFRSSYVRFTEQVIQALSPQRHVDRINCPVALVYGSLETPEFIRQSREFAEALQAAGKSCQILELQGYNHFEVLETLASPYGQSGRIALRQMGLGRATREGLKR